VRYQIIILVLLQAFWGVINAKEDKKKTLPCLGVVISNATLYNIMQDPNRNCFDGAQIIGVYPDTAAHRGGLSHGDQIFAIDGKKIFFTFQVSSFIKNKKIGDEVTISFIRKKQSRKKTVRLMASPSTISGKQSATPEISFNAILSTLKKAEKYKHISKANLCGKVETWKNELSYMEKVQFVKLMSKAGIFVNDYGILVNDIRKHEATKSERPFLGAAFYPMNARPLSTYRPKYNYEYFQGVKIKRLIPDFPAEKAGLIIGDYVTHLNDRPTITQFNLVKEINLQKSNATVTLRISRGSKVLEKHVHLVKSLPLSCIYEPRAFPEIREGIQAKYHDLGRKNKPILLNIELNFAKMNLTADEKFKLLDQMDRLSIIPKKYEILFNNFEIKNKDLQKIRSSLAQKVTNARIQKK